MKYIIEIEDESFARKSTLYGEEALYRADAFKSLVFGKNLNKGMLAFQDKKMGGYNILIVWLDKKKNFVTGDDFEIADITGVNAVLHFCDKSSVDVMIKILEQIRERWEDEE